MSLIVFPKERLAEIEIKTNMQVGLTPYLYISANKNQVVMQEVYKTKISDWEKILKFLGRDDKSVLTGAKKVYVTEGSRFRKDQWSDFFRKNNLKWGTLGDCDLIVSTGKTQQDHSYPVPPSKNFLAFYLPIASTGRFCSFGDFTELKKVLTNAGFSEVADSYHTRVIMSIEAYRRLNGSYASTLFDMESCMLFQDTLKVLDRVITGCPVISEDCLRNDVLPMNTLDSQMYNTLSKMFSSNDSENHVLAREILYNCDVLNGLYWVRKLTGNFLYVMQDLRTKAGKRFVEITELHSISSMNSTDFLKYLVERKLLNREAYEKLMKDIRKELENSFQSDIYDVVLLPKELFKTYENAINGNAN